jgi:L-ribulose-5-phosphate 4-epimerase
MMAITPSSLPYERMTAEDIMILDVLTGSILEGKHKPSSEWPMHRAIFRNRKDACAVVHTHSPYATSFAVLGRPIPAILIEMLAYIGGDVPVADFELPGSQALGELVSAGLTDRNACLMKNHGAVAIGSSIEQAYLRAVYVEDAAKIYSLALSVGIANNVPDWAVSAMTKR